jgi:Na+(H+)/acetate symporter ActP
MVTLYVTLGLPGTSALSDRLLSALPLDLHAGVWSVLVNFFVTYTVSRFTAPPSAQTVRRIHGEVERFVYGDVAGEATS